MSPSLILCLFCLGDPRTCMSQATQTGPPRADPWGQQSLVFGTSCFEVSQTDFIWSGLTGVPPDLTLEVEAGGLCPSCLPPKLMAKIPFLVNRADLVLLRHI